jgi:predicted DNA-binding protein
MTKQRQSKTEVVWARLTKDERERLEALAQKEDRTLSYVITRLLRQAMGVHGSG